MTHKEKFVNLGIHPPKGVLLYGPPGTGNFNQTRDTMSSKISTLNLKISPQEKLFWLEPAQLKRNPHS